MDFKNIKVRVEEAIGFVQIDRVVDKNSLNIETSKEILQALTNFDQDNTIKCIAIVGNQKLQQQRKNYSMLLMKFTILKSPLLHWLKGMLWAEEWNLR
jgi:1,4-dihydroxy-2-naphthoyl-CoA synthase